MREYFNSQIQKTVPHEPSEMVTAMDKLQCMYDALNDPNYTDLIAKHTVAFMKTMRKHVKDLTDLYTLEQLPPLNDSKSGLSLIASSTYFGYSKDYDKAFLIMCLGQKMLRTINL